jgi:hypothetical protein
MKAICITNRNHDTPEKNGRNAILTIGKIYDVRCYAWDHYVVVNDVGHNIAVPMYYFKLIEEFRKEQIDKILECTTSFA